MAKQHAFTLVEILVVIAVIVLLLGMIVPTAQRMAIYAEKVSCFNNVHQLSMGWYSYGNEHQGMIMGGWTGRNPWDWVRGGNNYQTLMNGAMWQYVKDVRTYKCPSDFTNHCWTYAVSGVMNGEHTRFTKYMQVVDPAVTMVFMEEDDYRGYNTNSWMTNFSGDKWIDYVVGWHDGGANVGFADGHAEHWIWEDPRSYTWRQFYKVQPGADLKRLQSVYYPH